MPDPSCKEIFDYFMRQWVNKVSPSTWNHFETTSDRTNNRAEGFHSKINKLFNKSNPNIYNLINFIKSIETESMIQLQRVENDPSQATKRRKIYIEKDFQIELIKHEYIEKQINHVEFFRKMCELIQDPSKQIATFDSQENTEVNQDTEETYVLTQL